jgi:hypothetical protein
MGTLEYMPPEVFHGAKPHASQDIYALGLCLRRCLDKTNPWQGLNEFEIMGQLREGGLRPLAETGFKDAVSIRLVRLCNDCMQRDPTKRPLSVDVSKALSTLQTDGVGLFDKMVHARERMRVKDQQFYNSTWDEYVQQDLASAQELQATVKSLEAQYAQAPRQVTVCGSFEALEKLADCHAQAFHATLAAFIRRHGGAYYKGPRKQKQDCVVKVLRDYEDDYSRLLDFERGTGAFPDLKSLNQAVAGLAAVGLKRLKDRLHKPFDTGYRDLLINVQSDGLVGELQLTVTKLWDYKEVAHRALEFDRVLA